MISRTLLTSAALLAITGLANGQWVTFSPQTATRMPTGAGLNTPATSTTDPEEKDYAWGDVDQDGDIDLVCVRKQPFTSPGRRINVLFMNEGVKQGHALNGVLVDRTILYATAVDMNGDGVTDPQPATDQGFNTPTNDRDVVLADVNNDGWLDIITATTLSDGQPKHIGHPRVYMNLGESGGNWLGFRHEPNRIPQMHTVQPRFCSVAAGDVTGDGYVDLYFGDYDSGGAEGYDYNNKLLINRGATQPGFFDDSTTTRITASRLLSAFGAASVICDMNNDGVLDAVKQTSLASPTHVAIHHNNPANVGFFPDATYKMVNQNAPYFVSAGDLNNDGRLDLIITDDGQDAYMLNTGNAGDGTANFTSFSFGSPSSGFGSQSIAADLNNDGWKDVLISDVDVDIGGCDRRLHIYRNFGNPPNVSIQEQSVGGLLNSSTHMSGTHNVAVFDIDGDGWQDLVIGRCNGTFIWMNTPPSGIAFSYPGGLPAYLAPDQANTFEVQLTGISGAQITPDSGQLHYSIDGGPFTQTAMTSLGNNLYSATIPPVECTARVRFYFSGVQSTASGPVTRFDPPNAPAESYLAISAVGTEIALLDNMEGDVSAWTVSNSPSLTAGAWEAADPIGTFFNAALASPEDDANNGLENVRAFVTQNGLPGGSSGAADIDDGTTYLVSPTLDLDGSDATISYQRWFFASLPGNSLATQVSNDNGNTWTPVDSVLATISDGNGATVWQAHSFIVGAYVEPTSQVRIRFAAAGPVANAVVEAGIDAFRVDAIVCGQPCPADIVTAGSSAGMVDIDDLLAVISAWGACPAPPAACPANIVIAGASATQVDIDDLLAVISAWGACP